MQSLLDRYWSQQSHGAIKKLKLTGNLWLFIRASTRYSFIFFLKTPTQSFVSVCSHLCVTSFKNRTLGVAISDWILARAYILSFIGAVRIYVYIVIYWEKSILECCKKIFKKRFTIDRDQKNRLPPRAGYLPK